MSRLRQFFASLAVTVMITDLALVAFAFSPGAHIGQLPVENASASLDTQSQYSIIHSGTGSPDSYVQSAFWGKFWKRVKSCIKCGGNHVLGRFGIVQNPGQSMSCKSCRGENIE